MARMINVLAKYDEPKEKRETRGNKKKTHEEYIIELAVKNPTVEVVENYINAKTKIMHRCLIHNIYWKTSPGSALQGSGCEMCHKEKIRNALIKTHQEYVKELRDINHNIEVIGEYVGADTLIMHHCKIHDVFWNVRPQNLLNGQGCILCGREKTIEAQRKTHTQYVQEVNNINPNIEVIGTYINTRTSILHKCLVDGCEWNVMPSSILNGNGCPKCANNIKKTHEQYINELIDINPNVEPLEEYINFNTPILHKCKLHYIKWRISPAGTLKGNGCPKCWRERQGMSAMKTNQQYIEELSKINPNIVSLEEYNGSTTPILHRCLLDEYEWHTTPQSTLQGSSCPKCAGNIKRTHEQYTEDVIAVNPDIEVIGIYVNSKTPIEHRCKVHNCIYTTTPENVLLGHGTCPYCKETLGERNVRQWLEQNNIEYVYQHKFDDCKDTYVLPFDFFLPNFNKLIEYDGKQHFEPVDFANKGIEWAKEKFELTKHHDNIKNEYCKNNGISLLRIPYYKNIKEELNNFLFI